MFVISADILTQFDAVLRKRAVPGARYADYRKWLRYYLDYCRKYPVPDSRSEPVRLFMEKLREKKQSAEQLKQAAHAVSLYFETQARSTDANRPVPPSSPVLSSLEDKAAALRMPSRYSEPGYALRSDSPGWDKALEDLAAEIKTRQYSRSTLKTYALWSRQFQRFLKSKPPKDLSTADAKEYLTYLAVSATCPPLPKTRRSMRCCSCSGMC